MITAFSPSIGKMESASRQEGRTVLFVSHDLHAVRELCCSAVLLKQGEITAMGEASSVIESYTELFRNGQAIELPPPPLELQTRGYLTECKVETTDRREQAIFAVGESWRIRVTFRLCRGMDDFVIGIGFLALDGTAVQTAWAAPCHMERGDYEAIFIQSAVHFAAGNYNILVGLSERDQTFQQPEVGQIGITGENVVGYYAATSGAGAMLNSTEIQVRSL
jgi:hypothetical protein